MNLHIVGSVIFRIVIIEKSCTVFGRLAEGFSEDTLTRVHQRDTWHDIPGIGANINGAVLAVFSNGHLYANAIPG